MVLAFFYLHFDLKLIPVVILGASAAVSGRVILSLLARNYFRPFMPRSFLHNYDALGNFFTENQKLTVPLIFTYAFLPIPSNDVFIIAGLAKLNIRLIAGSFLFGRLISYTFWVSLASRVSERLENVFTGHLSNGGALAAELIGFSVIFLVGKIRWGKILRIDQNRPER